MKCFLAAGSQTSDFTASQKHLNASSVSCFNWCCDQFVCVFHYRRAVQETGVHEQPMGQEESDLPSDKELEGTLTLTSYQNQLSPLSASGKKTQRELGKMLSFFLNMLKL